MKIHNTEIDPSTITRLTIEHAHGLIDLSGNDARAAIEQIRTGKRKRATRVASSLHPTAVATLRALEAGPLTVEAAAVAVGLSRARSAVVLGQLCASGRAIQHGSGRRGDPFFFSRAPGV